MNLNNLSKKQRKTLKFIKNYSYLLNMISNYDEKRIMEYIICGGRMAAKTRQIVIAIVYILWNDKLFGVTNAYIFRKFSTQISTSVWAEVETVLRILNIYHTIDIKITERIMTFPNGNRIYYKHTNTSSGGETQFTGESASNNPDTIIQFWEEAYQFTAEDFYKGNNGIRGAARKIVIKAYNPTSPYSDIVTEFDEVLPFDMKIMKSKGEMLKVVNKDIIMNGFDGEVIKEKVRKVYHRTNHLINYLLQLADKLSLYDEAEKNPKFGEYILWGKNGSIGGAIYFDLKDFYTIKDENYFKQFKEHSWVVGIDWAVSKDKATCHLCAYSRLKRPQTVEEALAEHFHVRDSYIYDPKKTRNKLTDKELAIEMVLWVEKKYREKNMSGPLTARVDFSVQNNFVNPQITLLNQTAQSLNLGHLLFIQADKSQEKRTRIKRARAWISEGRYGISETKCFEAIKEYDNYEYDKDKTYPDGEYKPKDGNDDCIDGISYAHYV